MFRRCFVVLTLLSVSSALAPSLWLAADDEAKKEAAEKKPSMLVVGDTAPALSIEKWVKGTPVKGFEKGKVYVVEFWATWCGPCVRSMPHLTKLQEKYKDKGLTIIGTTSADETNTLEAVEKMVRDKGDKVVSYSIAWDKGQETSTAYMEAAGQTGIPCAFVVNQEGQIAYIGHPEQMDDSLDQVVAGKHDLKQAAAAYKVELEINAAMREGDTKRALNAIDSLLGKIPGRDPRLALQKFEILLFRTKDYDAAYALGRELVAKHYKDDAEILNAIAWTLLDSAEIEKRDVDLSLKAAERANEVSGGNDASILDTLAFAYHHKGDAKKAVEIQRQAVAKAGDEIKGELEERLKTYEEAAQKGESK